jgi:hypothetical protein
MDVAAPQQRTVADARGDAAGIASRLWSASAAPPTVVS